MGLRPIRAEQFIIRIDTGGTMRKLFRLMFGRDGSIYASFPYFEHNRGIMAVAHLSAGPREANVDLSDGGRVTAHRVKYSHHESGWALFSLTGKVRSEIRRQSVPLAQATGHLFTIQIQEFSAFESDEEAAPDPPPAAIHKKRPVTFVAPPGTEAARIALHLYPKQAVRKRLTVVREPGRKPKPSPYLMVQSSDGSYAPALVMAAPHSWPGASRRFLLTLWSMHRYSRKEVDLTVLGGFDSPEIMHDLSQPTSFLAMTYPAENYDELRERLGSIDLTPLD